MSAHGLHIADLYFRFSPVAGHYGGCPHAAGDLWEATRYTDTGFDGQVRATTFRLACHSCGVVHFERIDGDVPSFETTHASQAGYASRPQRVAGLWLWPGPRMWHGDERGPASYYVTRGKTRPRQPGDAAGVVGWHLGKRGGIRWAAGLDPTSHGTVRVSSERDWPSRRAAVAWIAAHLTETAARGDDPDDGIVQAAPLDSEPWTCRGCGRDAIGRRPADDLCRDCATGGAR